jgi:uncharacterized protein
VSILIDGHNLIGQISDMSLSDPNDEAELVQRLRVYRSAANRSITVVFDHGAGYVPPQSLSGSGVEVVFANLRSSADEHIVQRIRQTRAPHELLVISSDQDIRTAARSCGAQVMTSQEFAQEMRRTHAPKRKRVRRPPREASLSPREVEEWLAVFKNRTKK